MKENSKRLKQFDTFIISKYIHNLKIIWLIINFITPSSYQSVIVGRILYQSLIVLRKAPSKKKQHSILIQPTMCYNSTHIYVGKWNFFQ